MENNQMCYWQGAGWYAPFCHDGHDGQVTIWRHCADADTDYNEANESARWGGMGSPALWNEPPEDMDISDIRNVTVPDASNELGITRVAVRKACERGSLRAVKFGRDWIITMRDLEDYRANNLGRLGPRKKK